MFMITSILNFGNIYILLVHVCVILHVTLNGVMYFSILNRVPHYYFLLYLLFGKINDFL